MKSSTSISVFHCLNHKALREERDLDGNIGTQSSSLSNPAWLLQFPAGLVNSVDPRREKSKLKSLIQHLVDWVHGFPTDFQPTLAALKSDGSTSAT